MKRAFATIAALAVGFVIVFAGSASGAPKTGEAAYQAWLDETAVIVSVDGVETRYTERQVGVPAFQSMKHQQFVGGIVAQIWWWNCAPGTGCWWEDFNGGGTRYQYAFSVFGTNCSNFTSAMEDEDESLSADYGSGYDLRIYANNFCLTNSHVTILTSHSANLSGLLANAYHDGESLRIGQYG